MYLLKDNVRTLHMNQTVQKIPDVDTQYTDLVNDILMHGEKRVDRTGVGTLSVFGRTMRFDLASGFPLLTSKKVYFKGVVEELLWMIKGCTDAKVLAEKNVHIWDGNSSREFLDSHGLPYAVGELGPIYGHQWRHFNAEYTHAHADYTGKGIDQLHQVIDLIKNNPTSRRIILTAWNPEHNRFMALPACHTLCQFYVNVEQQTLSCQLYQRSGDVGLGIPFNIASYALLTHLVAKVCNLGVGHLVHTIGDAHVYLNHVDAIKQQLKNETYPQPTLKIKTVRDIDGYTAEDIELENYKYCKAKVSMKMAV